MLKKISSLCVISLITLNVVFAQQNMISLDAADAKFIINKNIYGHFAEHLGNCIYNGFYVLFPSKEKVGIQ